MSSEIFKKLEIPLSDTDLKKIVPNLRIIKYSDLAEYNDISQLLRNTIDYVVILVEQKLNVGHWQGLLRQGKNIEFFDAYGQRPDKALLWTPQQLRKGLGQNEPHLSYLLNKAKDDGFRVTFNVVPYQNISDASIETCGRHLASRILFFLKSNDISEAKYKKYMDGLVRKYEMNYDLVVSKLIG